MMTASIRGVVPSDVATGAKVELKIVSAKNAVPVSPIMVGVTKAAVLHPNLEKIFLPINIIPNVTVPVADEKLPMKAE